MSVQELEGRRYAIELPGDACYRFGIHGLPARQRDPTMNFARIAEILRGRAATPPATTYPAIVQPMPRREVSHAVDSAVVTLPRARPPVTFKPGIIRPIGRLFVWLRAFLRFYFGNLVDVLSRRDSIERRAVRLRRVFEDGGPTFAKLAQQLSMRADMLPYRLLRRAEQDARPGSGFPDEAGNRDHRAKSGAVARGCVRDLRPRCRSDLHRWPAFSRPN